MLHEFLNDNQDELIRRCQAKVAKRTAPRPTDAELHYGIPLFLQQLVNTLRREQTFTPGERGVDFVAAERGETHAPSEMATTAAMHGSELLQRGFTVEQVVHDYGDLCQAVSDLAVEQGTPFSAGEFRTLNRCLDDAIAGAVTEYGRRRDLVLEQGTQAVANERLGFLAHEMRNLLNSAMLAVAALKSGNVGLGGSTAGVLDRSLLGMRNLVDRSLAEVRLAAGLVALAEPISVDDFIQDVRISAEMEAKSKGLELIVPPVDQGLTINADRHMLSSAVTNLLQNAIKFTHPHGHVRLKAYQTADHLLIEIQDECGGLPPGKVEELFLPFEQRGVDRTGLGLGLSICKRAIEVNGGKLHVRNLPGKGCVFTIEFVRQFKSSTA